MTHGCELHHTLQHTRVFGLKKPRCRCSPLGVLSEAQRFLKSVFRVMKQNTRADGEWTWSLRRWLNSSPSCVDCATLESCCVFFTGTNLCLSVYLPQRAPENIHGHSRTSSHTGRHWEPALGCGVHTHTRWTENFGLTNLGRFAELDSQQTDGRQSDKRQTTVGQQRAQFQACGNETTRSAAL